VGKILIVDDELFMRSILTKVIKSAGFETIGAENGREAISLFKKYDPDLVLLDYRLPDTNGLKVLKELKKLNANILVIMLTAHGNIKDAVVAMKLGAYDYLTKPFDNEEIIIVINKAFDTLNLSKEVKMLRKQLVERSIKKEVIGECSIFMKVLEQVDMIADTGVTVLVEGETGTGKEVIAKLIHTKSSRSDQPFIAVDCGAVPETLFESELFGFEKGSFTGASRDRTGKFEQANNGTIFLDEINNLPLKLQAKLLRVIEERSLSKIGSKSDIKLDVRIIAASNKDLIEDVDSGNFRNDLFYRINEFRIEIPSLQERKDDLSLLLYYFISQSNEHFNKQVSGIEPGALKILMDHDWPGNIREFRNVVQRAVLTAVKKIRIKDIQITKNFNSKRNDTLVLSEAKGDTEKEIIQKVLQKTGNKKTDAAKVLGISRRQLYRKLQKHDLI